MQKESLVGGTSPLNVNKAAEQGEMERKIEISRQDYKDR